MFKMTDKSKIAELEAKLKTAEHNYNAYMKDNASHFKSLSIKHKKIIEVLEDCIPEVEDIAEVIPIEYDDDQVKTVVKKLRDGLESLRAKNE